jgi:ATP-dependent DNA helicase PIF1
MCIWVFFLAHNDDALVLFLTQKDDLLVIWIYFSNKTVKSLMPHVIETTILIGCAKDEDVFISRIPMVPTDMPFEFKCLQFPIHLAFAISINRAQRQSLKVAGINLKTLCVSHVQLHVACSRVGTWKNLYVFAPNAKTRNIVYQTTLQSKLYPIGQFLLRGPPFPCF